MDILKNLPQEIENKFFYMIAEHPVATLFKKYVRVYYFTNTENNTYKLISTIQNDDVQLTYIYDATERVYED